jgi:hypothetical protein
MQKIGLLWSSQDHLDDEDDLFRSVRLRGFALIKDSSPCSPFVLN